MSEIHLHEFGVPEHDLEGFLVQQIANRVQVRHVVTASILHNTSDWNGIFRKRGPDSSVFTLIDSQRCLMYNGDVASLATAQTSALK